MELHLDPRTITELELLVRVYGSRELRYALRDAVVKAQAHRLNTMAARNRAELEAARPQGPFIGKLATGGTGA